MRKLLVSLILLVALPLGAARFFDGSNDKLQIDSPVISGTPFTMCGWFNSNNVDDNQQIVGVFDVAGDTDYYRIQVGGGISGDPIRAQIKSSSATANVDSTTGYSANVWNHACLVGAADNDWSIYLNGGSKGTSNTSVIPAGLDNTAIGIRATASPAAPLNGEIAEVAIWNVALTDAEVAILAAGFSPLLVNPQGLVAYWPLIGRTSPEIDLVGGNNLTVTESVVATHTRMFYPTQPFTGFAAAAVPPAGRRRIIIISEMLKYAPAPILAGGLGLAWVINRRNKLLRDGRN